jgi:outer membrane protein TolC
MSPIKLGEPAQPFRPILATEPRTIRAVAIGSENRMLTRTARRWSALVGAGLLAASGCATTSESAPVAAVHQLRAHAAEAPTIQLAAYTELTSTPSIPAATPFAGLDTLSAEAVVNETLARNPTLAERRAAWEAASARPAQASALDDPMFTGSFGPGTFGSNDVNFAYIVQLSQKFPYPGKRQLRGAAAAADARAAGNELADVSLQLVEAARAAFYDYYLADRALTVNAEGQRLLGEFRNNAKSRYENAQAPEQDVLQADVEIGRLKEREQTLRRMRNVAAARINTLIHASATAPLPPPPAQLDKPTALPPLDALIPTAIANRPDLRALADRVAADRARFALAGKEFYPDFTPFAAYNRFMGNRPPGLPLAYSIGVSMNLPVYKGRLNAALAEARAKLAQREAELARQTDQAAFQVREAYERAVESARIVRLYEDRILRDARRNVQSAQPAYVTGKIPFLTLVETERLEVGLRDRYYQAIADYHARRAALERAVGGSVTPQGDQEDTSPNSRSRSRSNSSP